ncbi:MAG TPA: hypothetical protein VFO86_08430, partial [Terriglobia bacterium]|nr:hypothetical protein [Terriglobia bacterium]
MLTAAVVIGQQTPATRTSTAPAAASTAAKPAAPATAAKPYIAPRTPDGQPDLQGYWTNATYAPLERTPANATANKLFFTKEEYDIRVKQAALQDEQQTTPGTTGDVHYDFTQFGLDKSQNPFAQDLRTSMITDPPDGRIPAQTAAGQKRNQTRTAAYRTAGGYNQVQDIVIGSRCIIYNPPPGPPMLPQGYNGNYQIIQSKDSVMILFEQIGDIRIIALDNRPAPPLSVRNTMGISRGHWEGDTLVIETTNFAERPQGRNAALAGISDNFKLIERLKRTGEDSFDYEFTVNDPETFVKPWTASMPFTRIKGPIFEAACHEGNYGIEDTMKG